MYLDDLLGVQDVQVNGEGTGVSRAILNIISSGATVVDNVKQGRTDLTLPGGGGSGGDAAAALVAAEGAQDTADEAAIAAANALANAAAAQSTAAAAQTAANNASSAASTAQSAATAAQGTATTAQSAASSASTAATAAQTTANAAVPKALFDANTLLKADTDNTPAALVVPASTFVGRAASGGIAALSVAQAQTLLGVSGSSSGGATPLYLPPSAPEAFDTEFDSDPGWLFYSMTSLTARSASGTPDLFSALTPAGVSPRLSVNTQRKSWAVVQTPAAEQMYYYCPTAQTPTLPTWYWCRVGGFRADMGGVGRILLFLTTPSGGLPTYSGGFVGFINSGGTPAFTSGQYSSGSLSSLGGFTSAYFNYEYFGIYKSSSSVVGFVFDEAGNHLTFTAGSDSRTTFYVGIYMMGTGTGQCFFNTDFVRSRAGNTPPWMR